MNGKNIEDSGYLNIYGQKHWHDTAYINGTKEELIRLRDLINVAINSGCCQEEFFASDGEGYTIEVVAYSFKEMDELSPQYSDKF